MSNLAYFASRAPKAMFSKSQKIARLRSPFTTNSHSDSSFFQRRPLWPNATARDTPPTAVAACARPLQFATHARPMRLGLLHFVGYCRCQGLRREYLALRTLRPYSNRVTKRRRFATTEHSLPGNWHLLPAAVAGVRCYMSPV